MSCAAVLYIRGSRRRRARPGGRHGDVGRAWTQGEGSLRLRRHRARPGGPHDQPQRGRHLLGALRPPLRDPDHRRRHGRRGEPGPGHRDGAGGRPRRPEPRGHLLPLREPRRRARPHHLRQPRGSDQDHPGHLRRAHQGRADPPADHRDQEGRRARGGVVDPPARRALRQDRRGGRRRLLRRAVHGDDGPPHRDRVSADGPPAAQEAPLDPAHRRQRRHLRGVPRAHGLRGGRAPDRRRSGRGVHQPRSPRDSACRR